MTLPYAEITFLVDRGSSDSALIAPRLVCERCRLNAQHNLTLRISFCPIHGFAAGLVEIRLTGYARARGATG